MRAGDLELLYDLPEGTYADPGRGGYRTRTIRSGSLLEVEVYPILRWTPGTRREAERRRTTEAQARLNRRRSMLRCMRLIEANFTARSWVVTLTYDYGLARRADSMSHGDLLEAWEREGLPTDEADARRDFFNWIRKVKRRMEDPAALKYIYALEVTHEPRDTDPRPLPARYHFHLVIDAAGVARETLKALWGHGFTDVNELDLRGGGAARLADYLTRQEGRGGKNRRPTPEGRRRRWAASRNLIDPEKSARVSDRRISRRRAARVAEDVRRNGREIFEALYPGYRLEEEPAVRFSDFAPGAWIYARLRRLDAPPPWGRKGTGGMRREAGSMGR